MYFRMVRVSASAISPGPLTYHLPYPENEGLVKIMYFKWFYGAANETNVKFMLKPYYLYEKQSFYDDVMAYAYNLTDGKFTPQ